MGVAGLLMVLLCATLLAGAASERDAETGRSVALILVHTEVDRGGAGGVEEIIVGTGFVVVSEGYLLTDRALVTGSASSAGEDGQVAGTRREVTRVEVLLPAAREEEGWWRFDAGVVSLEEDLGLALLSVEPWEALPALPLGDSDALGQRQSVTAWSYATGEAEDWDVLSPVPSLPAAGSSSGRVGLRLDDRATVVELESRAFGGEGAVGGPILDPQGYVVGIVQERAEGERAVRTGLPVSRVKDFLELSGLAGYFPRRLSLAALQDSPWKGLGVQAVAGLVDRWPGRTRWDSGPSGDITLRIDRLATPLAPEEIEARVLSGSVLDGFPAERLATGRPGEARSVPRSRMRGYASALGSRDGTDLGMEYMVVTVGPEEKLVARYTGTAEVVAYNRGALRRSLQTLQVRRLLTLPVSRPLRATLDRPSPLGHPRAPDVAMPARWTREPGAGFSPAGLPPPDASLVASPPGDFSVVLQALWWEDPEFSPREIVPAGDGDIGGARNPPTDHEFFGVTVLTDGVFQAVDDGLLLLELRVPREKASFLAPIYQDWIVTAAAP
jgi:hypothetical protein